jgi:pyruvate formate lyase activating enzyme
MVGREVTVDQVLTEVEKDRPFYEESGGGVTLSGGEPLAQSDFIVALTRACREEGFHVAVDTCGLAPWEVFEDVRKYVDLFLFDLKLMDDARHRQFIGESNKVILDNLRSLSETGQEIIIRFPIVPDVTDDKDNIRQIGAFAAALPSLRRVELLPYYHIATEKYRRLHRRYELSETRPPEEQRMVKIASVLREYDLDVKIGG